MQSNSHILSIFSRTAAVAFFAGAATLGVQAQQRGTLSIFAAQASPAAVSSLLAANVVPASPAVGSLGYSSSVGADETNAAESFSLSPVADPGASPVPSPGQPPPRRYGRRPVYADGSHNADGSNKYTFAVGGGFTLPVGGTKGYANTSYSFQGGIGRNFNKKYGVLAQFDWDNFGINGTALNQFAVGFQNAYGVSPTAAVGSAGYGGGTGALTASAHVWSFTLNPIYNIYQADHLGAYVIVGGGFYHKVTTFAVPQVSGGGYGYGYGYGYGGGVYNQTVDHYTSNAPGVNGGIGITYKFSHFGSLKAYAEARYVYVANSSRPYFDGTSQGYNGQPPSQYNNNPNYVNLFPQNSATTTYIPIKFGIRF